jgi:hypothetical protein
MYNSKAGQVEWILPWFLGTLIFALLILFLLRSCT